VNERTWMAAIVASGLCAHGYRVDTTGKFGPVLHPITDAEIAERSLAIVDAIRTAAEPPMQIPVENGTTPTPHRIDLDAEF
jgi:hypothetical protein